MYVELHDTSDIIESMRMKVRVLLHVPYEGIGSIEGWLKQKKARVEFTRFYEQTDLPPATGHDLIIVMGGPMSANDEARWAWLVPEKQFIRDAVSQSIPLLGICLGSQLIASALGSRVYQNPSKEIGFYQVDSVEGNEKAFAFPHRFAAFHWHGETFDLPAGAVHLARSLACKHQAFQFGDKVIGLQFHLEATQKSLQEMIGNCHNELVPGPSIQSAEEIVAQSMETFVQMHAILVQVLNYLIQK